MKADEDWTPTPPLSAFVWVLCAVILRWTTDGIMRLMVLNARLRAFCMRRMCRALNEGGKR